MKSPTAPLASLLLLTILASGTTAQTTQLGSGSIGPTLVKPDADPRGGRDIEAGESTFGVIVPPKEKGDILRPATVADRNPDPNIVEVVLVAAEQDIKLPGVPGKISMYAYNGTVPGPTIEANVGDRLIVHFLNLLPEETTIHWHGLETPANMDGSHIAQLAVEPGETFTYDFVLNKASLYWYHPHVRTNEQVEKGLHGLLLVRDPVANRRLNLPETEHLLVLDDILIDRFGEVAVPFDLNDPLINAVTHLNGRVGNHILVNGHADRRAQIRGDVPHRFRVVNVSNSTFFRLSVPGHTMYRIGGDVGLLESPFALPEIGFVPDPTGLVPLMSDPNPNRGIFLTPGERADFILTPLADEVTIFTHDKFRGIHTATYDQFGAIELGHDDFDGRRRPKSLLHLETTTPPSQQEYVPPAQLRVIEKLDPLDAVGTIVVSIGHGDADAAGEIPMFALMPGGNPLPFPLMTPADAPDITVGETWIWEVQNLAFGVHNFHTHGFSFQLFETQYVDANNPANNKTIPAFYTEEKDTIRLPPRPGAKGFSKSISRLVARFDDTHREGRAAASGLTPTETHSGGWLFHCHILEHSANGMMGFFEVFNP